MSHQYYICKYYKSDLTMLAMKKAKGWILNVKLRIAVIIYFVIYLDSPSL